MVNLRKAFTLFVISLKDSFKANSKPGKMKVLFPIFMVLLYIVLSIVTFEYGLMFCQMLAEENLEYISILMFYLAAVLVMFMMTTYKARGALFGAKDTQFLLSLPIPNSSILTMRILNMMFFNYLIGSLLMIPPTFAYSWFGNDVNWLLLIVGLIFIPFIPTMLACCVGSIIGLTISKSKHKSIIEAIMSFVFIFLIFGVAVNFGDILTNIFEMSEDVLIVFKQVYFPIVWLFKAVTESNIVSMILFAIINLVCLALFVVFFNKAFVTINQNMAEKFRNAQFELKLAKQYSQTISLLIKELKLYTQSSIHMLNTCFGSVSVLIFALSTFFYDKSSILNAFSQFNIVISPEEFVMGICGTMIALSCTTPASISMEGKSLWCLRSMPIKEMTIFNSKMLVDLCFIMPANIISAIIIGINFDVNLKSMFLIVLFMILVGASMTHFGLILNLLFPKLKFKTDVEVVKQSMAANLAVYIPMIVLVISIFVYMIIKRFIIFDFFVLVYIGIMFVILVILHVLLRTYGVRKFRTLYC